MPLDQSWSKVAQDRPDARTKETNHNPNRAERMHRFLGWMEPCFCVNCGKPHGMISKEWAQYVFAVCDDCVKVLGPPPGVIEIPSAVVKGQS